MIYFIFFFVFLVLIDLLLLFCYTFIVEESDTMKKNGFTLVELLGVVTILAMLGLVIVPVVNKVVTDNRQQLYDVQIRNIKSAASQFVSEHVYSDELDILNNSSVRIKLGTLKTSGYIDSNISNPISKQKFSDDLYIMITNKDNNYTYTVCDGSVNCYGTVIYED